MLYRHQFNRKSNYRGALSMLSPASMGAVNHGALTEMQLGLQNTVERAPLVHEGRRVDLFGKTPLASSPEHTDHLQLSVLNPEFAEKLESLKSAFTENFPKKGLGPWEAPAPTMEFNMVLSNYGDRDTFKPYWHTDRKSVEHDDGVSLTSRFSIGQFRHLDGAESNKVKTQGSDPTSYLSRELINIITVPLPGGRSTVFKDIYGTDFLRPEQVAIPENGAVTAFHPMEFHKAGDDGNQFRSIILFMIRGTDLWTQNDISTAFKEAYEQTFGPAPTPSFIAGSAAYNHLVDPTPGSRAGIAQRKWKERMQQRYADSRIADMKKHLLEVPEDIRLPVLKELLKIYPDVLPFYDVLQKDETLFPKPDPEPDPNPDPQFNISLLEPADNIDTLIDTLIQFAPFIVSLFAILYKKWRKEQANQKTTPEPPIPMKPAQSPGPVNHIDIKAVGRRMVGTRALQN